jgi:hypothetical protein
MEDDLKILRVDFLSNHSSNPPHILNLSSGDQTKIWNAWNKDNLQTHRGPTQTKKMIEVKTTSDGRGAQNIRSTISQQPLPWFETLANRTKQKFKIALNEANCKNGISQQLLVRCFSNFKFKLRGPNWYMQWKLNSKHKV